MRILVLGGTKYFGIHMVEAFLEKGHSVTIATRGKQADSFGDKVERLIVERASAYSLSQALEGKEFDVICDNIAYCSNDVKYLLETVKTNRYVMTSTMSVYSSDFHLNMSEKDFDPMSHNLVWCDRKDFTYDEVKRQAESALFKEYSHIPSVAVRFPYVIGTDDYTKRLLFYIEHVAKSIPMNIDNLDSELGFVDSKEAGMFLAWIAEQDFIGPINGANVGSITLKEIIAYLEDKTGKKAIISKDGDIAPYNGAPSYSVDTSKADSLGFKFTNLQDWIFHLLDKLIIL